MENFVGFFVLLELILVCHVSVASYCKFEIRRHLSSPRFDGFEVRNLIECGVYFDEVEQAGIRNQWPKPGHVKVCPSASSDEIVTQAYVASVSPSSCACLRNCLIPLTSFKT